MDLNLQYSLHQFALMRANFTHNKLARTKSFAAAGVIANRIRDFQLSTQAPAADCWLSSMEESDLHCVRHGSTMP